MEGGEKLLYDMFPSLDRVVVSNVFHQCKRDLDASINFLLDIASNSAHDETTAHNGKEYVNVSYWGGTNTNAYDAPSSSRGSGTCLRSKNADISLNSHQMYRKIRG